MEFSSGARNGVVEMASWVIAAVVAVMGLIYHNELRQLVSGSLVQVAAPESALPQPSHRDAPASQAPRVDRSVQLRAGSGGHYEGTFRINGRSVEAMVDTGATVIALTFEDARAAGIHPGAGDFRHAVQTANGTARVAAVTLEEVAIEDIIVRDVRAVVAEQGKLATTLLGMSFLSRLSSYQVRGGVMTLQQ